MTNTDYTALLFIVDRSGSMAPIAKDMEGGISALLKEQSELPGKLTVPLRLVPGNAADVAELWVLTRDAVDQLDALVRDADERLMARLSFAVAEELDGTKTIVLRTRPSKLAPLWATRGRSPM